MPGSAPPSGSSNTSSSKPAAPPAKVTSPEGTLAPPVVLGPSSPDEPVPDLVTRCQKRLIELGWLPKAFAADGNYGPADGPMAKAVKEFQRAAGIQQNGLLGPQGQAALFDAKAPRKTSQIPDRGLPRSVGFPQVAGVFMSGWKKYGAAVQEWGRLGTFLTYCQPGKMDNALDLFGRDELAVQVGWEPHGWDLVAMVKQFEKHWDDVKDGQTPAFDSSDPAQAMIGATAEWANTIAGKKPQVFFIRMMSEMTMPDNVGKNTWHLKKYTPKQFADAWNWIHRVFDAYGATNALFCFNVAQDSGSRALNMPGPAGEALKLIEPGRIDSCGLHPYTRKASAAMFKVHCTEWIDLFKAHRPDVHAFNLGEFGFEHGSDGHAVWDDAARAAALAQALEWAQGHFKMITYFDDTFDWKIDKASAPKTWAVLHQFLQTFPGYRHAG